MWGPRLQLGRFWHVLTALSMFHRNAPLTLGIALRDVVDHTLSGRVEFVAQRCCSVTRAIAGLTVWWAGAIRSSRNPSPRSSAFSPARYHRWSRCHSKERYPTPIRSARTVCLSTSGGAPLRSPMSLPNSCTSLEGAGSGACMGTTGDNEDGVPPIRLRTISTCKLRLTRQRSCAASSSAVNPSTTRKHAKTGVSRTLVSTLHMMGAIRTATGLVAPRWNRPFRYERWSSCVYEEQEKTDYGDVTHSPRPR